MDRISRRSFLKGTFAVGAGAVLSLYSDGSYKIAFAQGRGRPEFRLQVLHTNDHHARIEPVPTSAPLPPGPLHGGVSRRKTLIDQIREAGPTPLLLLDAGDIFQGTLYFNLYNGQADLAFYNAMRYDAVAVGNHEFDKGQQVLADFIAKAKFPMLSANTVVDPSSPLAGMIQPRTIINKAGRRVGIFGLTTEETSTISNPGPGVSFTPAIAAAQAQVAALQAEGVDYIIALSHIGYLNDIQLARSVSGISLIVGGHSHTPMKPMNNVASPIYPVLETAPDGKRVVVVQDWEWGRWLGNVTLTFNEDGDVIEVEGQPIEVLPSITPDPEFEALVAFYQGPLAELNRTVIGESLVFLDGVRNNVRSRETNLGNLITEAMLAQARFDGATIAFTNGGGIRASIGTGPVTVGEVLDVLPFGNTLARVDLTGAQIRAALEHGVRNYTTVNSSGQTVLAFAGNFPQVAGIRFSFDPNLPSGARVTSLTLADGTPVNPAATYRVVTNNFLLAGGDGYAVFTQGANRFDYGFIMADEVMDYITANSPIDAVDAPVDGRITSAPLASLSRRSALTTLGAALAGLRG